MSGAGIGWDAGLTLADRFRRWAGDSERVYPYAVRAMADDWEAGGPVREICRGYEDAPNGAVIQLRLLGGVFRLVLTRRAGTLAQFYPCLGGTADPTGIWPVLRAVLAANVDELHAALQIAPQTNEVGRSAALLVGLSDLVRASGRSRIRLLEVGASAGLNLLLDGFSISGDGWTYGPADSALRLEEAVQGDFAPADFTIAARRGCDLHPIDPTTTDGRLMVTSFVWPDDVHRFERLRSALAVADRVGAPVVDAAGASAWLPAHLDNAGTDELTVVWNSITQQYWPAAEVEAVRALLAAAGESSPLARVSMEFRHDDDPGFPEVRTTLWAGDGTPPRERLVARAHHHGLPVLIEP